jgi:predicted O-methyltransferase YrrM
MGFTVRASQTLLRHPGQGIQRTRARLDTRRDRRELAVLGIPRSHFYQASDDWARRLHEAIGAPWPCDEAAPFAEAWDATISDLRRAGMRIGLASYRGWNDADKAQCSAIWCVVAHLRPSTVVETGVAHGVTTRLILEGLERTGNGRLWSVDLPAIDPALHQEIGIAVPKESRVRWTYVEGTSRDRLPQLVNGLGQIDLFVHDSLHTARNVCFELDTVWPVLRPGAVAFVDDIDRNLGFTRFTYRSHPHAWLAGRHLVGGGVWGVAVKGHDMQSLKRSASL